MVADASYSKEYRYKKQTTPVPEIIDIIFRSRVSGRFFGAARYQLCGM